MTVVVSKELQVLVGVWNKVRYCDCYSYVQDAGPASAQKDNSMIHLELYVAGSTSWVSALQMCVAIEVSLRRIKLPQTAWTLRLICLRLEAYCGGQSAS